MSQIPIGWLMKKEGLETIPYSQQVTDDADGIPVTGPNLFFQKDIIQLVYQGIVLSKTHIL